jgi:hypothetical protein
MEVRCVQCGLFFSIDDNIYRGEYENFCSVKCQADWMEGRAEEPIMTLSVDDTAEAFKWEIPEEEKDG